MKRKSKFTQFCCVFAALIVLAIGVLAALSPLWLKYVKTSASAEESGPSGPVPVALYWKDSMIRQVSLMDENDNVVMWTSSGQSNSPELAIGGTYTFSLTSYSGDLVVNQVILDTPYTSSGQGQTTVSVLNPNNNSFVLNYQDSSVPLIIGIGTTSSGYSLGTPLNVDTSDVPSQDLIYFETTDNLMPRKIYPGKETTIFMPASNSAGSEYTFDVSSLMKDNRILLSVSKVSGTGSVSVKNFNVTDGTFDISILFGSSSVTSYDLKISITSYDITDYVEDAYDKGYSSGYNAGHSAGYDEGYQIGFDEGVVSGGGYNDGYNAGYSAGLTAGQATTWEDLNVVGLFLAPVNSFLATPLFGSFSIGTAFSVVVVVLLGAIFIKMFAGG